MPINGGMSVLKQINDADDAHPIHEYHEALRRQGYKPAGHSRLDNGNRNNHYVGKHEENSEVQVEYNPTKKKVVSTYVDPYNRPGGQSGGRKPQQMEHNMERLGMNQDY